ncbi:MAG: branched-chain amino acid ABC transporter permease [Rhodobacteraceae bacterium]|nr:branched-chain amino acid ABC transporter permease [Paracoccaceae bacterium]
MRNLLLFGAMALALILAGQFQSWAFSLTILNLSIISAIMALGVNIQWGYAGIFNVGIMGFAALGGLAAVLTRTEPVAEAWAAGGAGIAMALLMLIGVVGAVIFLRKKLTGRIRSLATFITVIVGYFMVRYFFDPATNAIESIDPALTGYLGGANLPIVFSWAIGGLFAGAAAWLVGKIALGLRSDYLAIATLGISEIIIAVLKNEEWLARGVKNISGLDGPMPRAIDLQTSDWFLNLSERIGADPVAFSGIFVKAGIALMFTAVLVFIMILSEKALNSPWGRMMRAIRDNRDAAEAMGKDVTKRHLQTFVIGSAVVGIAGAMLITLDLQFTPGTYNPLRFTFLIWVMVIVGGSGNNWGSVLGGFLIWFVWIEAERGGPALMQFVTAGMAEDSGLREHLIDSAAHLRLFLMGVILLLVLRFSPKGLIPEKTARS